MRAVSLSNPTVIALLNGSYVPVFVSNEDYREQGAAPPEEKTELHRIFQEGYAKHLSVGTVHAYILAPDGHLIDSMHTAQVAIPDQLIPMLERNARALHVIPGAPVVRPIPPSTPGVPPGGLLLHLTARYLDRRGDDYALIEDAGGNWSALPSEDWISLDRNDGAKLLPGGPAKVGEAWDIDPALTARLLAHFYPPTENSDLSTNHIEEQSLRATLVSEDHGRARARVEGHLRMQHTFYHKPDDRYVEARIIGYLDFDLAHHRIHALRLVTTRADYRGAGSDLPYGIAVRSRP